MLLLWTGRLKYSFSDYDDFVEPGETLGDYPHARREMGVEMLFLVPVILGMGIGACLGVFLSDGVPPVWIQSLGGSMLGYLVGGGLVWAVRILGRWDSDARRWAWEMSICLVASSGIGILDPIIIFFLPFIDSPDAAGVLHQTAARVLRPVWPWRLFSSSCAVHWWFRLGPALPTVEIPARVPSTSSP